MNIFSPYYIGLILNFTCLLIVAGAASSFSLRTGEINLGGEAQVYVGGFVTAIVLGVLPKTVECGIFCKIALFLLALFGSAFCGMLFMLISILLKKRAKIDILLSSFLLSSGIIQVLNYCITNDFRDKTSNLLSTVSILNDFKIPKVFIGLQINISLFFILGLYVVFYFYIFYSRKGKIFLLCGSEKEFASCSGFNVELSNNIGLLISGALYSVCGFLAIIGTYYSCHIGFYSLYGWNGLTVALIAKKKPFLLVPAALFLGFISIWADNLALFSNFDSDLVLLAQGILFFFISAKKRGLLKTDRVFRGSLLNKS